MHTESHPLAGKTVRLNSPSLTGLLKAEPHRLDRAGGDAEHIEYWVEDWQDILFGKSWGEMDGNPACLQYAVRSGLEMLPDDDECVYGKIGNLGYIVHVNELGEVLRDGR